MGTGPWKLEKYTPNVGVTYTKNPDYWDKERQPKPDRNEIKFYAQEHAAVLGIQGGEVDVLAQFSAVNGKALLTDPEHQCDRAARVAAPPDAHAHRQGAVQRQARAPGGGAPDQPRQLVKGLLEGKADFGNDSPFAPVYPVDRQVRPAAQAGRREGQGAARGGRQAERLQRRAAHVGRFRDPELAQLIQNDLKAGGHQRQAQHHRRRQYYGDAVFGKSPWLDSTIGITDYGHRGVPNVFLGAPLQERRHVERGALQEQGVRRARRRVRRGARPPVAARRRRRRSRRCCSTRCRSSSPTSTTS